MNNRGVPTKLLNSSSSSESEKFTIAYAESAVESESGERSVSTDSMESPSSSSLETPTSQESVTSLFALLDHMQETEKFFGYGPVWRTMSTSEGPKMRALDYFKTHSVFQLFTFMMSHLLAHAPEDPVPFLEALVDRCIRYRDQHDEPPLLFQDAHISSVYTALDPLHDGTITYGQYLTGVNTLGVTDFNVMPDGIDPDNRDIPRDVFLTEVKMALLRQLDNIIGKPQKITSNEKQSKTGSTNSSEFMSKSDTSTNDNFEEEFGSITHQSKSKSQPTI